MTAAKKAVVVVLAAGLCACSNPSNTAAVTMTTAARSAGATTTATSPRQVPAEEPAMTLSAPVVAVLTNAIGVDDTNPDAVARAVVLTTNQVDTETDSSRLDALRRAARWLTPALLAGSLATPQRPDADWSALTRRRGYTTVDHIELANEYGQPPNTAATHNVQISYQIHKFGRDGWKDSNSSPYLARLRLIKRGTTWKVRGFD